MTATAPRPFGRTLCAMITPFTATGALDHDAARAHAARLVAEGCDGIVLSGTTGESPTTTDAEKSALLRAVRAEVGDGVPLLTGVGSPDTAHTLRLAREAEEGARTGCWWSARTTAARRRPPSRRTSCGSRTPPACR